MPSDQLPTSEAPSSAGLPHSSSLHPIIVSQLRDVHDRLAAEGDRLSIGALDGYYATFRQRFGPDVLRAVDGEALLTLMHDTGNRSGLVYWLEFKDDEEFPAWFGSIAGGSALKFGLYRRSETGAWTTGSPTAQREISIPEAVSMARVHRDELVAACRVLDAFEITTDDAAYASLESELSRVAPTVSDGVWGHKYLSLLYPEKLDDFHAPAYQRFHLMKLLQLPPPGGRYVCAGRFIKLAKEFPWPVNHFAAVLNRRNGPPHRYWRIGTSAGSDSYWDMMRQQSVVAIGWPKLGDLSARIGDASFKASLKTTLSSLYPTSPQAVGRAAQQISHFCKTIQERDYVLASDGATVLGIGRVAGPYTFDASTPFSHQRPVEWLAVGDWRLPITDGLQTTVYDLRRHEENLVAIESRVIDAPVIESPPPPSLRAVPMAPPRAVPADPRAHSERWIAGGMIGRIQDVLIRKGQVILYGPPGTGKTHWAEAATKQLASLGNFGKRFEDLSATESARVFGGGKASFVCFCCFHPAYGYEDFIEGYRPVAADQALRFEVRDGVFKGLCSVAAANPKNQYYLLIDEINRGDIPRIFGELLTLLEKHKRSTPLMLPLSGEAFAVPPNLFVVGTMNTADRSIALLDTALRRRFGFIELLPDSSVLGSTVIAGVPLGPWLHSLNRRISGLLGQDGRNLQVGHSYFLSAGRPIVDIHQLTRVLQEDILPLLEEYCYDNWDALEQILGKRFVDVNEKRFRTDLLAPDRQDDLVLAMLEPDPAISASAIAVAADAAAELGADTEKEDDEDAAE